MAVLATGCMLDEEMPHDYLSDLVNDGRSRSGVYDNEAADLSFQYPPDLVVRYPPHLADESSSYQPQVGELFTASNELRREMVRCGVPVAYTGDVDSLVQVYLDVLTAGADQVFTDAGYTARSSRYRLNGSGIRVHQSIMYEKGVGEVYNHRIYILPREGYFITVEVLAPPRRFPSLSKLVESSIYVNAPSRQSSRK